MSSNKYVCIHGHFYQPPRENAWLEEIELQDSANPFHDWNERINFECYAPNTSARLLDEEGRISKIINNYTLINFNFGPTLLSWLKEKDNETYKAILNADQSSLKNFNGHGSAIAQAHSHLIMPLASQRDKRTQILWGLRDFKYRFGRDSEGIWLPETAVDTETLELLVDYKVKYTILAPRQIKAFKNLKEDSWQDANQGFDPRRPYIINLPSGRSIAAFFYDGQIAQEVAFSGLLNNGKKFAERFLNAFDDNDEPQLAHIATDGESYGHHHKYGEMALADCINHIQNSGKAEMINYGAYLEKFPPKYEAQIHESSSWSCVHGVERWRSNCGCNTGGPNAGSQEWRSHLRESLNWLRDELANVFEKEAGKFLKNPWDSREEFIFVMLNRNEKSIKTFLKEHAIRPLNKEEETKALRCLEMQRNAMYMFTSCGWFFDEISGIETNQIMQYALRAIEFASQVAEVDLTERFKSRLANAPSNVLLSGAEAFEKYVEPARVDLVRVGMHYATLTIFQEQPEFLSFFNYEAQSENFERRKAGNQAIAVGRTMVRSKITHSHKLFSFAVLYLGQQNIIGNISVDMDIEQFEQMKKEILDAFEGTNLGKVIAIMQTYFSEDKFSISHLFRDEKRRILRKISKKSLSASEVVFREIFNDNYQLMNGMRQSQIPVPSAFKSAAEFILNTDLHRFFSKDILRIKEINNIKKEFNRWQLNITNKKALGLSASERLFYEMRKLEQNNYDIEDMERLVHILETLKEMEVEVNIWKSQNLYFSVLKRLENNESLFDNDKKKTFYKLGDKLGVKIRTMATT